MSGRSNILFNWLSEELKEERDIRHRKERTRLQLEYLREVMANSIGTPIGCWGPCFTMSSHAALGVVRAGVAVLKGA